MEEDHFRVLIIDDIEANLQVLGNILGEQNVSVSLAKSGKQGIKIAGKKQPDLVLLDINMPEMSGYEVCKLLKSDNETKDIPIIFLSALSEKEDIVKGFEQGGVDYITKPFNKAELLSRVFTHIELKRSKEQLALQNEQLNELNATKDKFFSILAHDLRNPFSSILGFSELLLEEFRDFTDSQIESYLEIIYSGAKSTYNLLDNLLIWSRSQRQKIQFSPVETDLFEVVEENIILLINAAQKKEIKIVNYLPKPFKVFADNDMLHFIFRNLFSNAIKFTGRGGEVKVYTVQDNQNYIICVEDNGVGIANENLSKIFDFKSSFSTRGTEDEKGTGLGLTLCKEFVDRHNGKIWVESQLDSGTKFFFTLKNGNEIA